MMIKSNDSGGGTPTPGFCDGVFSKYSVNVQPLITTKCLLGSNCQSTGSNNAGGELTDYNKVLINGPKLNQQYIQVLCHKSDH